MNRPSPQDNSTRRISRRASDIGAARGTTARFGAVLAASAAFLAGMALAAKFRARRAEREHPPHGRFLDVEGTRLHYIERGDGPPVVLLHGNGAMIQDFEISGVLDAAAERHRVIAFDRPGFGHSDRPRRRTWTAVEQAELIHAALKQLGVDRPIVVGHSWGTLVALAMALAYPDDVRGLVLLSGYYFPTPRADVALLSPPAIPGLGDVIRNTISPILGRMLAPKMIRKVFSPAPVPARFTAEFPLDLALRPSQIRATAGDTALMIPAAVTLSERYGELSMPVEILAGTDDEIVDVDRQSKTFHLQLPESELRLIEGGGHMIHYLAPQQVVEAIDRISESGEAGRRLPDRRRIAGLAWSTASSRSTSSERSPR
jgi:pimeloyl-ACP methyl ester carboxylesterase